MSTKDVHAKCAVCGGLVHIGHDGEMALPRLRMSGILDACGIATKASEPVPVHSCCRRRSSPYNRRSEGVRRVEDREDRQRAEQSRAMNYGLQGKMYDLRDATPRPRRQLLREWCASSLRIFG
mgnify:CR=1 FL=1